MLSAVAVTVTFVRTDNAGKGSSGGGGGLSAGKSRSSFQCTECGWLAAKWVGKCGECQAWGTVAEVGAKAGPRTLPAQPLAAALPISAIDADAGQAIPTGIAEVDRVLGSGLVPGAVVLLAGEPGVGKSTLLLEVAASYAGGSASAGANNTPHTELTSGVRSRLKAVNMERVAGPVLYLTGEESISQVRRRAERVGALAPGLLLAAESDLGQVLGQIAACQPSLVIIDSVQTIASVEVDGAPGGVSQVREVAGALIAAAKSHNIPMLLIGHVTKDGTVAGPRTLEHLVDVVLQFEGESHTRLRLLRALKNRYGPTDEIGCFELSESGLAGFADPSLIFTSAHGVAAPGSCITVSMEGRRPIALEVQALVAPGHAGNPRRATLGIESSRLAMLLAVLHRHASVPLADQEVYLSTVGGVKLAGPAGDLAATLAIVSSAQGVALPRGLVALGEVGLAGDIRSVSGLERRLSEAARLGFTTAIVPRGTVGSGKMPKLKVIEVAHVAQAIAAALHRDDGSPVVRALRHGTIAEQPLAPPFRSASADASPASLRLIS